MLSNVRCVFFKNKNFKVFFFKKMLAIHIYVNVFWIAFLAFNNGTIVAL